MKKVKDQKQLWNAIAQEWNTFKEVPSELSKNFLKQCNGNVIDLGSGSGRHLMKINCGKMCLVDFSENMLELAKKKAKKLKIYAEYIVCDFGKEKLPFKDKTFSCGLSISALHCLPPKEHKYAIKELYRVLKPKAKVLIGVWDYNSKRFKRKRKVGKEQLIGWTDKGKRYYYLFEEKEIQDLFKKAGFKILLKYNSEMMINFIAEK